MKKLFAILPLLALCSCLSPQKTPVPPPAPPPTPDLNPMHAKLVIAPQPKFTTNILHWQWTAPDQVGLTSYKFYYGTNSRSYVGVYQLGSDTNFYMTNIDLLLDTNTWDTATTYQDGQTYTNVANTYVAITAQYDAITVADFGFTTGITNGLIESEYSTEAMWPPPPPPPWSALIFTWVPVQAPNTPNLVIANTNRNVTLLSSTALGASANWTTVTNVTGASLMLPLPPGSLFFRGVTTDLPPVQLQITGGYINGTN